MSAWSPLGNLTNRATSIWAQKVILFICVTVSVCHYVGIWVFGLCMYTLLKLLFNAYVCHSVGICVFGLCMYTLLKLLFNAQLFAVSMCMGLWDRVCVCVYTLLKHLFNAQLFAAVILFSHSLHLYTANLQSQEQFFFCLFVVVISEPVDEKQRSEDRRAAEKIAKMPEQKEEEAEAVEAEEAEEEEAEEASSCPDLPAPGNGDLVLLFCINDILTDDDLLSILSKLPTQQDKNAFGLVCKRWMNLQNAERRRLCVRAGPLMLERLALRFTRLTDLDFTQSASRSFFPGVSDVDLLTVSKNFRLLERINLRECKGLYWLHCFCAC